MAPRRRSRHRRRHSAPAHRRRPPRRRQSDPPWIGRARRSLAHVANAATAPLPEDSGRNEHDIIVSYDGTANDDDALALGAAARRCRRDARAGLRPPLARVRPATRGDSPSTTPSAGSSRARRGSGDPTIATARRRSARRPARASSSWPRSEGASLIVFGSDYRTPPGRVEPGQHRAASARGRAGRGRGRGRRAADRRRRGDRDDRGRLARRRRRRPGDGRRARREARRDDRRAGRRRGRPDRRRLADRRAEGPDRARRGHAARSSTRRDGSVLVLPRGKPAADQPARPVERRRLARRGPGRPAIQRVSRCMRDPFIPMSRRPLGIAGPRPWLAAGRGQNSAPSIGPLGLAAAAAAWCTASVPKTRRSICCNCHTQLGSAPETTLGS